MRRWRCAANSYNLKIRRFNSSFRLKKRGKSKSRCGRSHILCSIENISHTTRRYLKRQLKHKHDEDEIRPKKLRKLSRSLICFKEDNIKVKCLKTDSEKSCYTNTEVDLCKSTTCLKQDKSLEVNILKTGSENTHKHDKSLEVNILKTGSEDTHNNTEVIISENLMYLKDQNNHEENFSKSQSEKTHNDIEINVVENPMCSRGDDTEEKYPKSQSENIENDTDPNLPGSLMCIKEAEEDKKSEVKFPNSELQNVRNNTGVNLKDDTQTAINVVKCKFCKESVSDIVIYAGLLANSRDERDVLFSKELNLCEEIIDDKPQNKLTKFSVFDKAGHLCPFDGNLIPEDVKLRFSGYIKPIYDDNSEIEGGFPAENMGPISQWWIAGFDEGEQAIIGISSTLGDYYLMEPSEEYAPFMKNVYEKIMVTKAVVEFLQSKSNEDEIMYENLLEELQGKSPPIREEMLLKFSDFIYDQVLSFDTAANAEDGHLFAQYQCIRRLAELSGISTTKSITKSVRRKKSVWTRKDSAFIKATTTFLVENVFGSLFTDQINKSVSNSPLIKHCVVRLKRLDYNKLLTEGFVPEDVSVDMPEDDLTEEACIRKKLIRPCSVRLPPLNRKYQFLVRQYMQKKKGVHRKSKYEDDSDYSDSEEWCKLSKRKSNTNFKVLENETYKWRWRKSRKFEDSKNCSWIGNFIGEVDDKLYFQGVSVDSVDIQVGNFVCTTNRNHIAQVIHLYEKDYDKKICHVRWFIRSQETILGDAGNAKELFLTDNCDDIPIFDIKNVVSVSFLSIMSNWNIIGNFNLGEWDALKKTSINSYFYQKKYIEKYARFENFDDIKDPLPFTCSNCEKLRKIEQQEIPRPEGSMELDEDTHQYILKKLVWRNEEYHIGSCVFLEPGTIMSVCNPTNNAARPAEENYNETTYPEKYRKVLGHMREEFNETRTDPFEIGFICGIFAVKDNIRKMTDVHINVKKFYRPHNTHLSQDVISKFDMNYLYWSDEDELIKFDKVMGKCYVTFEGNLNIPVSKWLAKGPHRFYFNRKYDRKRKTFVEVTSIALKVGKIPKKSEKMNSYEKFTIEPPKEWPSISRPLRSMDIFAGCGGLSEGLHQSGVAECYWGIEKFEAPARAFRLNNPEASVFIDDCNNILQLIMKGETELDGVALPKRGEVELLCGGPPCQGFSRMNSFKEGDYSKFKNSLIVSYLSYCDYFKPRYFILENVRNFAVFDNSMVLKHTLSCLVKMGYQVTFGVLQCGQYGIPQSRRRVIILAAAPGEILPVFPEPTHTFILKASHLAVNIDQKKYVTNIKWNTAAPYRMVTVGDAISDLPEIENNDNKDRMSYGSKPLTHFQRKMRGDKLKKEDILKDHVCKLLQPLSIARISYIPRVPGADWRDLPNIVVQLSDGSYTKKLKYTHHDVRLGKSSTGALRGVCSCATNTKMKCKSKDSASHKQSNTLIPWCLPHTGSRHGHWNGLYGRLSNDGYFRTVVTNPEPMGKQGRVLHPTQNRVISIREYARSQGFPDRFKFVGDTLDKYCQIGNAVAPPLAEAIGYEIKKCVSLVEKRNGSK